MTLDLFKVYYYKSPSTNRIYIYKIKYYTHLKIYMC